MSKQELGSLGTQADIQPSSINDVCNIVEERVWPNDEKVGEGVHFNRLHNIKKNYQTLLNMAKGWPLNHNGALSFAHPKMIYFSGKCTFVLHTIYY